MNSNLRIISLIAIVFSTVLIPVPTMAASHPAASNQSQRNLSSFTISPFAAPDFSITANPTTLTLTAGQSMTVTLTAQSLNGFAGTVYLSASAYFVNAALNPSSLTLTAGSSATSTLTVTATSDTAPGSGSVFIDAVSPCALEHFADVSVTITGPDFTITAAKPHLTMTSSTSDSSVINLASINGFSGTVSVSSSSSDFTTAFTTTTVGLTPGGTGSTTVTVTPASTTLPGNYTLSIDGSSGLVSHSTDILVTVNGPTYKLTPPFISLTLVPGGTNSSGIITVSPVDGFTGTVTLTPSPSFPSGLGASLSVTSIVLGAAQTSTLTVTAPLTAKQGSYFLSVDGASGSNQQSVFVSVLVKGPDFAVTTNPIFLTMLAGQTCISTITVTPINGFNSAVGLSTKASTGLTASLSTSSINPPPGMSTLTITTSPSIAPGYYSVGVNATTSGTLFHLASVYVSVIGPSFELTSNPTSLTVNAGGGASTSTIGLTPENGFTGTVSLTATAFGTGLSATLSSPTITGTGTSTLSVSASAGTTPGTFYSVEVHGTSSTLSYSLYVGVTVTGPDFSLSASPSPVTFTAGTTTTSTVTLTPSGGFTDSVDLFVSSSFNLNATINPSTVSSGSYSATLSLNSTIPGLYSVDIFAQDQTSGLFHDLTIQVVVNGPSYSVVATPSTVNVAAGSSGTTAITIHPKNGFSSSVSLSTVFPPTGITAAPSPASITPGQTSTLTITVDPTVAAGAYTLDLQGTSGSLSNDTRITVNVSGFTVSANPDTLTIDQSSSKPSTITVAPQNGFGGTVTLTPSAPTGFVAGLDHNTIIGSGSAVLTINPGSSVSPGTYLVNVTGTSGLLVQKATITVTVPIPDFSITVSSPSTPTPADGTTAAISNVTITPTNGFTGTVTLTQVSTPSGLTCTFNPTSITGGTGTSKLSCTSTTVTSYSLTVTGKSGSLTHTATATLDFATPATFAIAAASPTVNIIQGETGTDSITLSTSTGFTGTVTLTDTITPTTGLTCALTPGSVTFGASPQSSVLSCNGAVGTYTVVVKGSSGSQTQTVSVTYTVALRPTTTTVNCTPSSIVVGSSTTCAATVTDSATGTITTPSGHVTFSSNQPGSFTTTPCTLSGTAGTAACSVSYSPTTSGTAMITAVYSADSSHASSTGTTSVTVTPPSPHPTTTTVTCTPSTAQVDASFMCTATVTDASTTARTAPAGIINFSPTNTCTLGNPNATSSSCTATYTAASPAGATTIIGTFAPGPVDNHSPSSGSATEQVTDFSLTKTSPASAIADGLATATSTITVLPDNGFTGTITLSESSTPTGLSCAAGFNPPTITDSGTSFLSCTSTSAITYTVTVTATAGTLSHTTQAQFTFTPVPTPDFTVTATSPASTPADGSTYATSTITVAAQNGFTGTVTFDDSPLPSGLTCTNISPTYVYGSGTATLACKSSTAGSYTVHITGTSSPLSHSATATFTFSSLTTPDFSISTNHNTLSIQQGNSGTAIITITPSGGFSSTVTLTSNISPAGPTAAFSTTSIIGGSGASTLTLNVGGGVATGTYNVTITAGSGSITKTATIIVTITAPTQGAAPAPILGLDPTLFYAILAAIIIVLAVGGGLAFLRLRKPSKAAATAAKPTNKP